MYRTPSTLLDARTWADVDLDAVDRNLAHVAARAGPGASVMLVAKADAYGHGAVPIAWHLQQSGVAYIGVGDSTEALELRAAGITAPVVVLGAIVPGELADVVRGGITVTVHSGDRVRMLRHQLRRMGRGGTVAVHLKVDTGMGRLGCAPERAVGIAREVMRSPGLVLEGVATHLASTGPDGGPDAERQMTRFRQVLRALAAEGIHPRWRHAHASGAILGPLAREGLNLVRSGLAIYGIHPHGAPAEQDDGALEPALSWRTQTAFLKDHRRGARIGYGGTWTAPGRARIATLPIGYNDGYRFAFSNRAEVLVRGRRCPVVGRVSMDYTCVDVSDVPGAAVGDVVTLLGKDGRERIRLEDLARLADTIPYEILCGLGRRVKRRYVSSGSRSNGDGSDGTGEIEAVRLPERAPVRLGAPPAEPG
jgi:alanine racemase